MKRLLFAFLFFSLGPAAWSQVDVELKEKSDFFHDKDGNLGIHRIKEMDFSSEPLTGGFFDGAVWMKLHPCDVTDERENLNLVYREPLDQFAVYLNGRELIHSQSFRETTGLAPHFWNIAKISKISCAPVYVRFQYGDVMSFSLSLMDTETLRSTELGYLFFYGFFFSVIFIALILSIYFFTRTRNVLYLYFTGLLIFQDILGASLLSGFLFKFWMPPSVFITYDWGNIFAPLMNFFLLMFARSFLRLPKASLASRLTLLFAASQLLLVSPLIVNLMTPVFSQTPLFSSLVNQSIIWSCYWALLLGFLNLSHWYAKLFLFASGFKVLGQLLKTLLLQGDFPQWLGFLGNESSFAVYNIAAIGSLLESSVFIGGIIFLENQRAKEKDREFQSLNKKLQQTELKQARISASKQVAHDIRSPLTALNMVLSDLSALPEDSRILAKRAVERINRIANSILSDDHSSNPKPSIEPITIISLVLDSVATEKGLSLSSSPSIQIKQKISREAAFKVSQIDPSKLSRALSNLINNAAEAVQKAGTIVVSMRIDHFDDSMTIVQIIDDGVGIPEGLKRKVFNRSFTTKASSHKGSGLGLSYAKEVIEESGGTIDLSSELGKGTCITIKLKSMDAPSWLCDRLELSSDKQILVVDDDPSIHQIWTSKLKNLRTRMFLTLSSFEAFLGSGKYPDEASFLALIDHDFNDKNVSGLEVIMRKQIQNNSVLVTNLSLTPALVEELKSKSLRILPKSLIRYVPVDIPKRSQSAEPPSEEKENWPPTGG